MGQGVEFSHSSEWDKVLTFESRAQEVFLWAWPWPHHCAILLLTGMSYVPGISPFPGSSHWACRSTAPPLQCQWRGQSTHITLHMHTLTWPSCTHHCSLHRCWPNYLISCGGGALLCPSPAREGTVGATHQLDQHHCCTTTFVLAEKLGSLPPDIQAIGFRVEGGHIRDRPAERSKRGLNELGQEPCMA